MGAELACMLANLNISGMPEILRDVSHACMYVSCMPDVMSLGFACDANHVSMMSLWGLHSIPTM